MYTEQWYQNQCGTKPSPIFIFRCIICSGLSEHLQEKHSDDVDEEDEI